MTEDGCPVPLTISGDLCKEVLWLKQPKCSKHLVDCLAQMLETCIFGGNSNHTTVCAEAAMEDVVDYLLKSSSINVTGIWVPRLDSLQLLKSRPYI